MNPLSNALRLHAMRALSDKFDCRSGLVTSYDPDHYAVKVSIQPEGINTNFIPLLALNAGNGFGIYAPPNIGDQVAVFFEDGSINAAFAFGGFFSNAAIPVAVPAGECLLQHTSGSLLHFKNDGSVLVTSHTDLTATIGGKLTATVTGDVDITSSGNMNLSATTVAVTGNMTVSGTLNSTGDGIVDGVNIKTHVHTGVSTGTGASGPPQ